MIDPAALAADLLVHRYQMPQDKAEEIVRLVSGVIDPPLIKELEKTKRQVGDLEERARSRSARVFQLMDRLANTLESMLHYAASIHPRHGHLVDVPLDDRQSYEIQQILAEWRQLGGQLLYDRAVVVRRVQRGQWDTSGTNSATITLRAKFD